jgi:hypothetical protein
MTRVRVFVSYSHSDESLVTPVVRLLRVNESLVFQDADRIPPGKRWRDEIAKALAESNLVVVFWCRHASHSSEVSHEWRAALEQEKDLLPLLLDATPLPAELAVFQWIDFRGTVGATHSALDSRAREFEPAAAPPPMAAPRRRAVWYVPVGVMAAAAVVLVFSAILPIEQGADTGTAAPELVHAIPWILIVMLVGALGAFLFWWRHRRARRRRTETLSPPPGEIERRIALELEAAIIRRVGDHTER